MDIRNGHLFIDGCDTVDLARQYDTPLYVLSLSSIIERVDEMKHALRAYP